MRTNLSPRNLLYRKNSLWKWPFFILLLGCSGEIQDKEAQQNQQTLSVSPPLAKELPKKLEKHGHVRMDPYYWLRERENPEVLAYLKKENAYTKAVMASTEKLQEELFHEIKNRIKQDDTSVPYQEDDYYYYSRTEDGKEYPIYCRKKGSLKAAEEVMLNVNEMARGYSYYGLWSWAISAHQDLIAFAVDTEGRNFYTIQFKNLRTGEILPDKITNVTSSFAWANDNKTFFYIKQHPETLRSFQVYRHILGTDQAKDVLIYEERDETFSCYLWKTKSKKYITLSSWATLSTEHRFLDADNPFGEFVIFSPRQPKHEYHIAHYQEHFLIRTNKDAKNFRLMKTPISTTGEEHWQEMIPHREDVYLGNFEVFENHFVLSERQDGLVQFRVISWDGKQDDSIRFDESAYQTRSLGNPGFHQKFRFFYESMTTPGTVYEYDMTQKKKILLKRDEILGEFDPKNYVTERLYVTARDGVKIPLSLVYKKGLRKEGGNPFLLEGYGSYGFSFDPYFSSSRLSLLERGFIYGIAHVRGGQEYGRAWYDEGKLLKKKNTFTDFIDCAHFLIKEKYTSSDQLFCQGGSAGGLLIGAVLNMEPELFHGGIAQVPFVDIVTTMLDEEIPLTTGEYDEWGNPNDLAYYKYMLSYSPYDNVGAKTYPHLLVTTGLHDSQVQYWEPAKWVAKLRKHKTDDHLLLLKTHMEVGHGGASGRYARYRETAFNYAFLIYLVQKQKSDSEKVVK